MEEEFVPRLRVTKSQIEEIKESLFWKDLERELKMWLEGFEAERDTLMDTVLEINPSTASLLTYLGDLNGRKKAINYMLSIPNTFLQILEDQKDDTEYKRTK